MDIGKILGRYWELGWLGTSNFLRLFPLSAFTVIFVFEDGGLVESSGTGTVMLWLLSYQCSVFGSWDGVICMYLTWCILYLAECIVHLRGFNIWVGVDGWHRKKWYRRCFLQDNIRTQNILAALQCFLPFYAGCVRKSIWKHLSYHQLTTSKHTPNAFFLMVYRLVFYFSFFQCICHSGKWKVLIAWNLKFESASLITSWPPPSTRPLVFLHNSCKTLAFTPLCSLPLFLKPLHLSIVWLFFFRCISNIY